MPVLCLAKAPSSKVVEASQPQEQSLLQRKNNTGVQGGGYLSGAAAKLTACKSTKALPHQWGPSAPQEHPQLEHAHRLHGLPARRVPTAGA